MPELKFIFRAELWKYGGKGGWIFATLPHAESKRIQFFSSKKRGWGSLRVTAKIGKTSWMTSIFPDKKLDAYVLPVKASVRKEEKISAGSLVPITLMIGAPLAIESEGA